MRLTCDDCGKKYFDFELHDEVWHLLDIGEEFVGHTCLPCFERDLGEPVLPKDFTSYAGNAEYIRNCDCCDERFRPIHELQWYCSKECGEKKAFAVYASCQHCHCRFLPKRKNQRYCRAECAYEARRAEVLELVCPQCGVEFDATSKRQKYCSLKCVGDSKKARHSETDCACGCGARFTPRRSDQRFATRSCAVKYARAHKGSPTCHDVLPGSGSIIC